MRFGRQMGDHVGAEVGQQRGHQGPIPDVAAHEAVARPALLTASSELRIPPA